MLAQMALLSIGKILSTFIEAQIPIILFKIISFYFRHKTVNEISIMPSKKCYNQNYHFISSVKMTKS
jgi:hypothetical protein